MADDAVETEGVPEGMPEIDLTQVRVEAVALQVASEMMAIGAGHLGLVPGMVNGGDGIQAGLAIGAADALVAVVLSALPEGAELPPEIAELRRSIAELKLAYAQAVEAAAEASEGDGPPTAAEPPSRPSIWTPGGEG
jgi:hypothetical protein